MATGTTVFSRVTVVAPRTRIDVALPADVAVADLLPMLLEMAKEVTPDGGARHGGWALAKLGDAPLDPSRTLASLGIIDGELLQLRKRNENPPPPLYDDVVDAIAEAEPDSFRPWTKETAQRIGHIAGGIALVLAALALFFGGPLYGGNGIAVAITAGVTAIACVAVGATLAKAYQAESTGVLIAAAGGLPLAFVSGFYIVPDVSVRANLLLASALVVVVAAVCILIMGTGITTFIAAATAGVFGLIAFLVGTLIAHPAPGIAAGTAAVALAGISMLPRATIWLAKLPLPHVPGTAEELKEDSGYPDYSSIERRTSVAHNYMTGLLVGCGAVTAISAMITASAPEIWGVITAVVATLVLLLRARTYANGSQAVALLTTGLFSAGGILLAWMWSEDATGRLLWVFGTLFLLAAAALVLGVVFPNQRFSPPMRRTVEIIEAICIASVLPLALAVMGLYSTLRHLDIG
ncbi:type VII secretion integral membrane protein EccD [Prauserella sp. PE36]|uniref:Type VII secretion integral membrane protein EccD n=1 Tax=Prauserella endophytica TaxID=1592324 RepID=A0ABY2S0N1_9PSEU|nr:MULTISPECIES: type VII secretion integral membrane protein EccD [Prauserella]PXY17187.1 type VII secretion integral membrane protein EccD [Prauserella coralliicola]RBM18444.1 type VII secretion integral membrane protein EccD [Prauserella sp. PE36]TKG67631.1 type VII secretion integral membrane protein EccD [Prauserella endophytica]